MCSWICKILCYHTFFEISIYNTDIWDNSSEFRYRNPIIDEGTLFITISQSGETADTLAAMSEASRKGAKQITLCNYPGTQSSRLADGTLQIKAGLEIGVAGTKTLSAL